ncbi:MAG: EAL domain-containing protein [Sideroxydans sp.]|nr:EAL domain-containing protein [Sideroxydans sp.]
MNSLARPDLEILRYAPEVVFITEADGRIVFVNDNAVKILGYSEAALLRMTVLDISPEEWRAVYAQRLASVVDVGVRELMEIRIISQTGQKIPMELNLVKMPNGLLYGSCRDISERKLAEQSLHQLTYYDALTQLPNRRALLKELQRCLTQHTHHFGALLVIDLDHFKSLKAVVGDALLIAVAQRLRAMQHSNHTLACLGGDVFVLLLEPGSPNLASAAELADLLAQQVNTLLKKPFVINEQAIRISASIGIALFNGDKESPDELLKQAKSAMDAAKKAGRDTVKFYNPALQSTLAARHELEQQLRLAIEQQQFTLYYQVQVDSQARAVGAEVLVRWPHPQRGMISPAEFIPLSEETGLILPLGLWVLEQACAQLKVWQKSVQLRDLVLAVNVSAKQLQAANCVAQVQKILLDTGTKASQLKLELTESAVLENIEDSINKMRALQLLGIRFSLDDFGTGHSSLQYLKRLPLDQIKIDQSFVRDITTDANDAVIVKTIISMSDALGLNVIAEGVETAEQRDFLEAHGCHVFQGYWFGRPLPLAAFIAALTPLK